MAQDSKERIPYWDNVKGILIFLVVFAHLLYESQQTEAVNLLVDGIYIFHMPAFVFISGYFSKSARSRGKESVARLLFAYLAFNAVLLILFGLPYRTFQAVTPYYSMWYILAVAVWRLTAKPLSKLRGIVWLSLAAALVVGFWPDVDNTLSLARIIAFLPFFMAGYKFSDLNAEKLLSAKGGRRWIFGTVSALSAAGIGAALLCCFSPSDDVFTMDAYGHIDEFLMRVMIFAAAVCAIAALLMFVPRRRLPLLTEIGRHSLYIYLCHRALTLWFTRLFGGAPAPQLIAGSLTFALGICVLFGSRTAAGIIGRFLDEGTALLTGHSERAGRATKAVCVILAAAALISPLAGNTSLV